MGMRVISLPQAYNSAKLLFTCMSNAGINAVMYFSVVPNFRQHDLASLRSKLHFCGSMFCLPFTDIIYIGNETDISITCSIVRLELIIVIVTHIIIYCYGHGCSGLSSSDAPDNDVMSFPSMCSGTISPSVDLEDMLPL